MRSPFDFSITNSGPIQAGPYPYLWHKPLFHAHEMSVKVKRCFATYNLIPIIEFSVFEYLQPQGSSTLQPLYPCLIRASDLQLIILSCGLIHVILMISEYFCPFDSVFNTAGARLDLKSAY